MKKSLLWLFAAILVNLVSCAGQIPPCEESAIICPEGSKYYPKIRRCVAKRQYRCPLTGKLYDHPGRCYSQCIKGPGKCYVEKNRRLCKAHPHNPTQTHCFAWEVNGVLYCNRMSWIAPGYNSTTTTHELPTCQDEKTITAENERYCFVPRCFMPKRGGCYQLGYIPDFSQYNLYAITQMSDPAGWPEAIFEETIEEIKCSGGYRFENMDQCKQECMERVSCEMLCPPGFEVYDEEAGRLGSRKFCVAKPTCPKDTPKND